MFEFKKLKEDIHDWANDVQGNSERTLEIIKEILVPINNITKLWKEDKAYIESQKEITLFGSNFYAFGNASAFLANLKLNIIKFYYLKKDPKNYAKKMYEVEKKL